MIQSSQNLNVLSVILLVNMAQRWGLCLLLFISASFVKCDNVFTVDSSNQSFKPLLDAVLNNLNSNPNRIYNYINGRVENAQLNVCIHLKI